MFPTKRSSADEAILGKPNDAATGATTSGKTSEGQVKELSQERKQEIFESIAGIQAGNVPENFDENLSKALGIVIQRGEVGEAIRTYAENPENVNAIGKAAITKSANDSGEVPQTSPNLCEVENGVVCRAKVQIPAKAREFQFNQGEQITNIIEKIVLQSRFCIENSTKGARDGLNKWFRIETQVYLDENALTDNTMGRRPKVYVFSVIEYEVDQAVTMAGNQAPQNTEGLKKLAQKEYNYIYTGKNKDILEFNIQYNNSFIYPVTADRGSSTAAQVSGPAGTQVAGGNSDPAYVTNDAGSPTQAGQTASKTADVVNGGQEWSETQVARQFNDALLDSRADLIEVELKIWGDPFWINDSGAGNYTARPTSFINITEDGSVDTQSSEVDLMLNFRTPFDIDDSGWMDFGGVSAPTKAFSGLYQCVGVVSSFSSGKFEQTLSLIRRRNQETDVKAVASKSGNALIGAGGADNIIDKVRGIFT